MSLMAGEWQGMDRDDCRLRGQLHKTINKSISLHKFGHQAQGVLIFPLDILQHDKRILGKYKHTVLKFEVSLIGSTNNMLMTCSL